MHRPPEVASAQAVLQHTPSVQKPLWHWMAAVHAAPFTFKPHELFTEQVLGATQSVSLVQVVSQAPALHTKSPQSWLVGVTQVPLPSHFEVGVAEAAAAQTAALQFVPLS